MRLDAGHSFGAVFAPAGRSSAYLALSSSTLSRPRVVVISAGSLSGVTSDVGVLGTVTLSR